MYFIILFVITELIGFGKIVNDEWMKLFKISNELFLYEYIIMFDLSYNRKCINTGLVPNKYLSTIFNNVVAKKPIKTGNYLVSSNYLKST
jgi:hypothetical protein